MESTMGLLDYLIPFVVGLGILIAIHEFGHYWVARRCGVLVLRFSIGFGRPLVRWRAGRDGTEWVIAAFPLGGYVKMLDEREGPVAPELTHRAFNRQPVGKRMAIVAAGPLANLALAVLIYWVLNLVGVEELRARVALVEGPSVAARAGFVNGDLITRLKGEPVASWQDLRWSLVRNTLEGRTIDLEVEHLGGGSASLALDLSGFSLDPGQPDLVQRIGLAPYRPMIPPVVGRLSPHGPAEVAGLQAGDRILRIDGQDVSHWGDVVAAIRGRTGQTVVLQVDRAGSPFTFQVIPEGVAEGGATVGRIGIAVGDAGGGARESMFVKVRYGVGEGLAKALRQTWETSALSLSMMGRMLIGQVSWKGLSGPVTIADYAGQSARLGLEHYIKFLALISISLGVLNLLPIPVLDGGHLLYYSIELIKGGPIPERIVEIGQQIGLAILVMLMAFAFYNDINRLISG
jgi:regulator of sigma E protease